MIEISDKPHMKHEFYNGTIIMCLPNSEETDWKFEVIRQTNGKTEHKVVADREQFEERFLDSEDLLSESVMFAAMRILESTVLANLSSQKVSWKPTEK